MALKLRQGQVWKQGEQLIRIVDLQRLEVAYKSFENVACLNAGNGTHQKTSKKEFCRLLKGYTLLA